MNKSMSIFLFGLISVFAMTGVQANEHHHGEMASVAETPSQQQVVSASGIIKGIDLDNKKITIEHGVIPSINWPAMTMRFTFTTLNSSISDLKIGNHVNFSFVQQGNISLLKEITTIQP
ncbi:cation efflux system protein CusF [Pectobacterium sp. B1J-3]|uniref:cation efflux system protein CusF n=1 Tax=Pectobacterium sp. B1J-3 TaxID=3385371 RepID=UPI0039069294